MSRVTAIFNRYFPTPGHRLLLFTFIFCFATYNLWRDWRSAGRHPFVSDADQYYSYVIAVFIHGDPGFHFPNGYWLVDAPNGGHVPKVSMGLAYFMAPFFLIGHAVALLTGADAGGYSDPYSYGIYYSCILIVLLGLYYLRKILLHYFSETASNLTVASVFFGTNLLYYTLGWNTVAHSYLFTLFAVFIYMVIRWYNTDKAKYLFALAFICGWAVLIRPIEIVIILVPLLYGVKDLASLGARLTHFWRVRAQLLVAALFFLTPWVPQLVYWKVYTGQWMFYSYGEEGFYFNHPQVFNVLLSYRKGWFVYTPIMLFAVAGFFTMKKKCPDFFWGVLSVFLITLYLISAWWAWWWGGCFGMRALIQHYALLALPMASVYAVLLEKGKKVLLFSTVYVMIAYNLYQTYRYIATVIHWDSMTREAFWWGIGKLHMSEEDKKEIEPMLDHPDYSKKGE